MAALLDATKKAALETRQASIEGFADDIRDELNSLTSPENLKHPAFGHLMRLHEVLKEAVVMAERTLLSNEDSYGKS